MNSKVKNIALRKILESIELPDGAYEKADERYNDIGKWLHRHESTCSNYDPHVCSQGSFRLGTAIKPIKGDDYDLDMSCILRDKISKKDYTQEQLKNLIGKELDLYLNARGIKSKLDDKRRCWRIEYSDNLGFHIDVVPAIPEVSGMQTILEGRIIAASIMNESLARSVSEHAISITDNADDNFNKVSDDWRISNPEGFAKWFESRMKVAKELITEREMVIAASIDSVPYYKWKSPLQMVIQILKRHRDVMFEHNQDSKPISVIITTLAARAYNGESDLESALSNIINNMDSFIGNRAPYVLNPVNPNEDFGDKWDMQEYESLKLRDNFYAWLAQIKADLKVILTAHNSQLIVEASRNGFSIEVDKSQIEKSFGVTSVMPSKPTIISQQTAARPWCKI